jgi:uncharacterized membrane protein YqjE
MLQSILQHLQKLSTDLKLYAEKRVELLSLELTEKFSSLGASLVSSLVVSAFLLMALLYFTQALVVWLNIWVSFPAFGQLVVGIFFFSLFLILFKTKKNIDLRIKKSIEQKILENSNISSLEEKPKIKELQ